MIEIKRATDGQTWVFEPSRFVFDVGSARADCVKKMRALRSTLACPYLESGRVHASFCEFYNVEEIPRWDFGLQFRLQHGPKDNVVYIESLSINRAGADDNYILVVLKQGELYLDAVLSKDDLVHELNSLHNGTLLHYKEQYELKFNGVPEALSKRLPVEYLTEDEPKYLSDSLTEEYKPLDSCRFVIEEDLSDKLKPKGMGARWLIPLAIVALGFYFFDQEEEVDISSQVVYETIDEWEDYKVHVTEKLPQASNRFGQDFSNHMIFSELARGWRISRVVHTAEQTVLYEMVNERGSQRELSAIIRELSKRISTPGLVESSQGGVVVVFGGQNNPLYRGDNPPVWKLQEAFEVLNDAVILLVPSAKLTFQNYQPRDSKYKKWQSMRVILEFTQMPLVEISMFKSITKYMPISILEGSYAVDEGLVSGAFKLEIHGEK